MSAATQRSLHLLRKIANPANLKFEFCPILAHDYQMNSTNLLLGSTGFLLLVALLFSYTQMNQGKNENPGEIASLKREIDRLENERVQLNNKPPTNLIFTSSPYGNTPPPVVEEDKADDKMDQIQKSLDLLAQENKDLRDDIADATRPAPAVVPVVIPEVVVEEVVEEEPAEPDAYAERRARLISNALLQATVQAWDPEFWTIAIDPAARANFDVGEELALRRNDGILCTFTVTSKSEGFFIGDLKSNLAAGAPDIVPGDELIIPPAFDRQLD